MFAGVPEANQTVSAVSIATSRSITAQLTGSTEFQSIAWDDVASVHNIDWLEEFDGGSLVRAEDNFASARLNLKRSEPRVKARIETRVDVRQASMRQRYTLELTPDPAGIETLRIDFRPPPAQTPT